MTTSEASPGTAAGRAAPSGPAPSGQQYGIGYGDQFVTVAEVGAAIREYRVGDREVFQSYGEEEFSPAFHGAVLLPWPNRIRDGRYRFDGVDYELALTEPARGAALHGLSPWRSWTPVVHEPDRIVLRLRLLPSPGYPFHLESDVEYALGDGGLRVTATSTNSGTKRLPYGIGFHPYLSAGGGLLDECVVGIGAERRIVTDDRLLPLGVEPVAGTAFDFRQPRLLGSLRLDEAFVGLSRDVQGRAWTSLAGPDGRTVSVWSGTSCPYWQVYSGDNLPAHLRRRGLAVEPMSAAPDAFNSGDGLTVLRPGESATATWGAVLA